MLNIIKADIKRLFISKGFWFAIGIYLLIYCGSIFMQLSAQSGEGFGNQSYLKEPGFYIFVDTLVSSLNMFVQIFGFGFGNLILGIYFTSFVCDEYDSGYIKNTAILPGGRVAVIISKLFVAVFITLLVMLFNYVIAAILGIIFINDFTIDSIFEVFINGGVMWLLSIALFSLIIFLSTFFRHKTVGIIIIFLISSGMILSISDTIFDFLNISQISEYTLGHFFSTLLCSSNSTIVHAFIMSIIYILVYNVLSILVIEKRDL